VRPRHPICRDAAIVSCETSSASLTGENKADQSHAETALPYLRGVSLISSVPVTLLAESDKLSGDRLADSLPDTQGRCEPKAQSPAA